MQSKTKYPIDARTFAEIWNAMTAKEKSLVYYHIDARKITSRQTLWNWGTGKASPINPMVSREVAKVVGKVIEKTISPQTLFPKTNKN